MQVDSHQHFWLYSPAEYPWIGEAMSDLRRDFLPSDLATELQACGLDGSIAVQARQSLAETRWLLELAEAHPRILGVVGWVDLRSPRVEDELAEFAAHPRFAGVRHVVQDEPDDRFLVRPDFVRGVRSLAKFGLTYDLLLFPHQLPAAIELVRCLPEQPFVLDHLAKPSFRAAQFDPWREWIRELARAPNVWCKVSGMVTEADWRAWQPGDFRVGLDTVLEAFGEDRLMFGSDWPVCLAAAAYRQVYDLAAEFFAGLSPGARDKIFGGNALQFYTRRPVA